MPPPKLTEEQVTTLDSFTESFRDGSFKERKQVVQNALKALFPKIKNGKREDKANRVARIDRFKPVRASLCTSPSLIITLLFVRLYCCTSAIMRGG